MRLPAQTILYLLDLFQKTSIREKFNFYIKTLGWNKEKLNQYKLERIKDLLAFSQKNVPYYSELLNSKNFNINDIKTVEEIKSIPYLTRFDIQQNLENLIAKNYSMRKLFKSSSSGTTGIPISYYEDRISVSSGTAALYFAYSLSGWSPGNKTLHIWGNPKSIVHWRTAKSRLKRFVKNQSNLASTEFNDIKNHEATYNQIFRAKYDCIDGYTTAIYELANYIELNQLPKLKVKNVFTTAENLSHEQKILIQKNVGQVSDLYGCGEIAGIAIQPINEDKYLIIEPHVLIEVEDSNENFKSIIATDLDNYAMPLIRYKIGDLIDNIYEPEIDQGVKFSYFKKIYGRESEIINLPNGKKILPVNIVGGTLFRKIGGISKHKVVWNGKELIFQFETTNEFSLDRAQVLIDKEFENYNVPIKINTVDKLLPDKNGKFKYFEKVN